MRLSAACALEFAKFAEADALDGVPIPQVQDCWVCQTYGITCVRMSAFLVSYQSALTLTLRPSLPRHGGRRPAIYVFADPSKERHGWPAFADHDDAVTAECHFQGQLVS